jgi:phenylacetate-coenzyme A ligase PaaK-like adenylate-forming protein
VRVLTKHALPEIEVDVETTAGADAGTIVEQLQADFDHAFRMRVPVFVVPHGALPRAEGKAKRVLRVEG